MASTQPVRFGTDGRDKSHVRRRLLDQAAELHGQRRQLRNTLPGDAKDVKDEEEFCADRHERTTLCALLEMKTRLAREVDAALRRVESGAYGKCAACGEEISAARLRAVPFAVRCRDCQEVAEADGDGLSASA
jgi:RNA polymerase-binding transcription factor